MPVPRDNLIAIIIDATYASVGTALLDLGLMDDETDLPQLRYGTNPALAITHLNSWVSERLGRVVILVPPTNEIRSDLPGIALSNLLSTVFTHAEDPI